MYKFKIKLNDYEPYLLQLKRYLIYFYNEPQNLNIYIYNKHFKQSNKKIYFSID